VPRHRDGWKELARGETLLALGVPRSAVWWEGEEQGEVAEA